MIRRTLTDNKLTALNILGRTRRHLLGRHSVAVLVNSRNGLLLVDAEDCVVGRKLAYEGEYGLEELARLTSVIDKSSNLLMLGAHVGALAVSASRMCAKVTAIEANPRTFRLLELNLLINGCPNVSAINVAASDKTEMLPFVMGRTNSGGSKRAPLAGSYAYVYDAPQTIAVPAAPLDEVLRGQKFDVVMMDIEGSEYFALKGMPSLLSSARVLFVEFVPHHLRNVSGVSVADFVSLITPHFSQLYVPSKDLRLTQDRFIPVLAEMFDQDESDDGLEFSK